MKRIQHQGHVNPAWRVCVCVCVCADQEWRSRMINITMEVKVLVTQSCPILWDPMDHSLPGSYVPGIFQAGVLVQVAISFFRGSSQTRNRTHISWGSYTGGQVLYQPSHQGSPCLPMPNLNTIMKKHQPNSSRGTAAGLQQHGESHWTTKELLLVGGSQRNMNEEKQNMTLDWVGTSAIKDIFRTAAK